MFFNEEKGVIVGIGHSRVVQDSIRVRTECCKGVSRETHGSYCSLPDNNKRKRLLIQ